MPKAIDIPDFETTTTISVIVTERLKRALREVSLIQDRSRNELVREALTVYLGRLTTL